MKATVFEYLRDRFHPLHHLRKSRFFRERLLPLLDKDLAIRGNFSRKIYVKAVTHISLYMAGNSVEPRIKSLFVAILEKLPSQTIFFDVGANVGLYTWLAAGERDDLRIISFEPDPENFRLLNRTASAWQSPNVRLCQLALSDTCGTGIFQRDLVTSATGSLEKTESFAVRHFQTQGENIHVLTSTLDGEAAKFGHPAIIKIDVEGHEAKVFAGAWETIEGNLPVVFFESFAPNPTILFRLKNLQYLLFDTDHGGLSNETTTNYVAVRFDSPLETVVRDHLGGS